MLYEVNRDEKNLEKAKKHADWLIQHQIQEKKYTSWGTPFNWKSGEKNIWFKYFIICRECLVWGRVSSFIHDHKREKVFRQFEKYRK